jgi:hypothetical protein
MTPPSARPWRGLTPNPAKWIALNLPRNLLARQALGPDASLAMDYHGSRPHLALEKQCPIERQIMKQGVIVEIAELGGLHHCYERIAA